MKEKRQVEISVPASTANLGSGYDSLGIAIDIRLKIKATLSDRDEFIYSGNGRISNNPYNMVHKSFREAFNRRLKVAPKVHIVADNPIPLARGLGSSSAAVVAGIALADEFMGQRLGRDGVFQLAAKLEGHPDNVAAAVYGGFNSSIKMSDGSFYSEKLDVPTEWVFLFAIPGYRLKTKDARAVLPLNYKLSDLVYNLSRVSYWPIAISQNRPEILKFACQDRIHEPYREKLIPRFLITKAELLEQGAYAVFLSGAGPTIAVICERLKAHTLMTGLRKFVGKGGTIIEAKVNRRGYEVLKPG